MLLEFEGYNTLSFPHCPCDARKNGHVIVKLNDQCLALQACDQKGKVEVHTDLLCCIQFTRFPPPQDQEHTFEWERIKQADEDIEGECFMIQYSRDGKSPKWIKIFSDHVSVVNMSVVSIDYLCVLQYQYMAECAECIKRNLVDAV